MVNLQLDWQQAAVLGAGLVALRVAVARSSRTARLSPFLLESAFIAGLYALWQLGASVSVFGTSGGVARGRWIERFQGDVGLPSERGLQHLIDGREWAAQACNLYYLSMHFAMLGVFLVWLFVRHRDRYSFVRNVLVVFTALALLIQLIPVAPPRLLPELGFVDIAEKYGLSVYNVAGLSVDELGAMPSVHVGWSLLIAWAVIRVSSSRWRWLAALHPLITVFVVVATGNHFWLDGIVAALLLVVSDVLVRLVVRVDPLRAYRPDAAWPGFARVGRAVGDISRPVAAPGAEPQRSAP
ncbi:MAG: hypothetical protein JWO63_1012 [Frankiales bacterium]|nr:hypothetical protein [Frankiales bacterium]